MHTAAAHVHAVVPECRVVCEQLHPGLVLGGAAEGLCRDEVRLGEGDAPRQHLQVALDPVWRPAVSEPQRVLAVWLLHAHLEVWLPPSFLQKEAEAAAAEEAAVTT